MRAPAQGNEAITAALVHSTRRASTALVSSSTASQMASNWRTRHRTWIPMARSIWAGWRAWSVRASASIPRVRPDRHRKVRSCASVSRRAARQGWSCGQDHSASRAIEAVLRSRSNASITARKNCLSIARRRLHRRIRSPTVSCWGPGHDASRPHELPVRGERAMAVTVCEQDVGQHDRIGSIGLGSRRAMPVSIARRGQRVDS